MDFYPVFVQISVLSTGTIAIYRSTFYSLDILLAKNELTQIANPAIFLTSVGLVLLNSLHSVERGSVVRARDWRPRGSWIRILLAELRFGTLPIPFTPLRQCLSGEAPKAIGPFYLVSMPREVKRSHANV